MYLSRWGLTSSPFATGGTFFHESVTHEEALARLHFLVDQQRRIGLLLGESGTGKSLLLDVLARQLRADGALVLQANLVGIDVQELLWQLCSQGGVNPNVESTPFWLWRAVLDLLVENRYQRRSTVLLLDDAGEGSPEVLQLISKLVLSDTAPDSRLTIVLATQKRRIGELGRRLLELAELRIEIEAWDLAEVRAYLKSALAHHGCHTQIFIHEAITRLHQLSTGIPRRAKQLADLALVAAAAHDLDLIDAEIIDGVFQELGLVTTVPR